MDANPFTTRCHREADRIKACVFGVVAERYDFGALPEPVMVPADEFQRAQHGLIIAIAYPTGWRYSGRYGRRYQAAS